MVVHSPAWHSSALRSEVPVSKEIERGSINSISLCEKCSVLDYEQMRSPNGQTHHENWTILTESAGSGCCLCRFFTLAPLHPKTSSRSIFYSDSSGPLQFKILPTYKREVSCLHVCVPQDKRTAAIYYLYLPTRGKLHAQMHGQSLRCVQIAQKMFSTVTSRWPTQSVTDFPQRLLRRYPIGFRLARTNTARVDGRLDPSCRLA